MYLYVFALNNLYDSDIYIFPKGNIPGLRSDLANDSLLSCISDDHEDLDMDWSLWKQKSISNVDQLSQNAKLYHDRNSPPWINAQIRHLLNKKNTIHRLRTTPAIR